jgi:DNA modification methylase
VEGFDVGDFGFEIEDLPQVVIPTDKQGEGDGKPQTEVKEDDFDPDKDMPQGDGNIKQGDIFRLGDHLLMCGDSTNADHLTKLLSDGKPDLVFTDPPYGISVVGKDGTIGKEKMAKAGIYMPVKGDETTDTAQKNFELLKSIGCDKFIIWGGNYFVPFLPYSPSWIIWDKRGDMNSNNFADGEMAWCSFKTPVRIYKQVWAGMIREGESEKRVHPTQKPIRLLGEIMNDFSADGDIVLDCFGGSGSTLIACEQVKRKCRMIEFEPYYVNVIIARWEKLTGQKAIKLNKTNKEL